MATGVLISFACGSTDHSNRSERSAGAGASGSPEVGDESAGAAGAGAIDIPPPVACGFQSCKAIVLGGAAVAPCCSNPATGICGADVSALVPTLGCQPLTQEGALDPTCPSSKGAAGGGLPLPPAPGCCNARTGQCGYWIGNLGGLLPFAPGCIDSASLGGGTPQACGDGEHAGAGAGGNASTGASGGAGGEASVLGTGGAAGAPALETAGAGAGGRADR